MNFLTKLYPPALTKELFKVCLKRNKFDWEAIFKCVREFYDENLDSIDTSEFLPIEQFGYKIRFAMVWNKWIKGQKLNDSEKHWLIRCLEKNLTDMMIMSNVTKKSLTRDMLRKNTMFRLEHGMAECEQTGEHFFTRLKGNQIYFEQFGKGYKTHKPKRNTFRNKIYEFELEFESGNLIIMDWYRFDGNIFTELVKKEERVSINYTKGIVEQISHYAKNFNFASVNVGNTCPSIFKVRNTILIGEGPENDSIGSVCTDLWNATVIDEKQLEKHLVRAGKTLKKAKSLIKELKKNWTCNEVKVKPGKYLLSFCGEYREFDSNYRKKNKVAKKYKPYFVIKKI